MEICVKNLHLLTSKSLLRKQAPLTLMTRCSPGGPLGWVNQAGVHADCMHANQSEVRRWQRTRNQKTWIREVKYGKRQGDPNVVERHSNRDWHALHALVSRRPGRPRNVRSRRLGVPSMDWGGLLDGCAFAGEGGYSSSLTGREFQFQQ